MRENRLVALTYGLQVTISLLVLGYFLVLIFTINQFVGQLKGMIEVHAFLEYGLSANDSLRIEQEIKGIAGVGKVKYISAEDALVNFIETTGIEIDSLLEENPLPDSYTVKPERMEEVAEIAEKVRRIQGVAEVRYGKDVVVRLSRALFIIQVIFGVTILLLLGASFTSINNIVRLSIYSRRKEIRIMQLVGATRWFIRFPFLFEGLFVGLLGGTLAAVLVWASYVGVLQLFEGLKVFSAVMIADLGLLYTVLGLLVATGGIVGLVSSFRALERYLYEDERMLIETARIRRELEWM